MDARERLRRYLEQRRELGESELVLDGMAVDDVMALLGARETAKPPRGQRGPATPPPPAEVPPAPSEPSERPTVAPPRAPDRRFDEASSGDWRETLRQASAASGNERDNAPARGPQDAATPQLAVLPDWLTALGIPAGLSVRADAAGASSAGGAPEVQAAASLDAIAELVRGCTRCALHAAARNAVPGEGDPHAELLCVGEAPGATEDEQGRPFVGEAGALLTKILSAIQLSRETVYICNVLKHRPPANRDPLPDEVAACRPFLQRQVELVNPRVILALGRFAAQTLLGTSIPLGKLRDQVHTYHGIPVIVTYHPAALLRNAAYKRPTWEDVQIARTILDASRAANGRAGDR